MRPAVARSPDSLCRRSARTATARKLSNELDDDVGDVSSLAGSFVKVAAAHRIQLGIRKWAMIFECGGLRSVVGLAHDLLHPSSADHPSLLRPNWRNAVAATVVLVHGCAFARQPLPLSRAEPKPL